MKKIVIIVILFPFLIFSQKAALLRADKKYNNLEYIEAIKLYEAVVSRGNGTPEIFEKLANIYYDNASYVKANEWFEKLNDANEDMNSENRYRYAYTLKTSENIQESEKQLKLFQESNPNQIRTRLIKNQKPSIAQFSFSNIRNLSINSSSSDYGAVLKGDTLLFSSARGQILSDKILLRTGQYNTNLYETIKDKQGQFIKPKLFSSECYSIYNEATPVFSKDGKEMFFTQNFLKSNSKDRLADDGFKLYKSILENGVWQKQEFISFSQKDSVYMAHPSMSPDGKFIYFASDMPGTYGDSDLFKIAIDQDGNFGKTEHLNDKINTEGRETFPFITEKNILIFASNGHPGMGGLDLYSIDLSDPDAEVINLGSEINSPFDDFGLVFNRTDTYGYFTSNKPGGIGDDDLYSFDVKEIPKIIPVISAVEIKGIILDDISSEALANVNVSLLDKKNLELEKIKTDDYGKYSFNDILPNSDYKIKITKFDKTVRLIPISLKEKNIEIPIKVNKTLVIPKVDITKVTTNRGVDIAKELKIDQIYFDSNKYVIRPDAQLDLDILVAYMNYNPSLKIEIGSHTDCIGSKLSNVLLSQKRAQSTLNYLVEQGINSSRLIAVGYGESRLVNDCSDGVPCSKEQNQQNRRSTFLIINK